MDFLLNSVYFSTCIVLAFGAMLDAPLKSSDGATPPALLPTLCRKGFYTVFFALQAALWILVLTKPAFAGYKTNLAHLSFFSLLISLWIDGGKTLEGTLRIPKHAARSFYPPLLFTAVITAINFLLVYIYPFSPGKSLPRTSMETDTLGISILFVTGLVVSFAIIEELIWRHYGVLKLAVLFGKKISGKNALLLSAFITSIIFCFGHSGNAHPAWVKALQIFFLSLFFSFARIKWGTIYAVILHVFINLSAVFAVLLKD